VHQDFAWLFDDSSVACFYTAAVESGGLDCLVEPCLLVRRPVITSAQAIERIENAPEYTEEEVKEAVVAVMLYGQVVDDFGDGTIQHAEQKEVE
jgi:hypothetical protein